MSDDLRPSDFSNTPKPRRPKTFGRMSGGPGESSVDSQRPFPAPPAVIKPEPRTLRLPEISSYHVLVLPRPPRDSVGLLALSNKTKNAERATCTIGQLLVKGAQAWKAKAGDLDPSADPVQYTLGDWVVYRQHSGQKLRIRADERGQRATVAGDEDSQEFLLIMSDTDVLARFASREDADQFGDWV